MPTETDPSTPVEMPQTPTTPEMPPEQVPETPGIPKEEPVIIPQEEPMQHPPNEMPPPAASALLVCIGLANMI